MERNGPNEEVAERIEANFNSLLSAYSREVSLKAAIDKNNSRSSFEESWKTLDERFPAGLRS